MLVFDRDCGFCQWSLRWARRLGATCEARAWQDCDLEALGLTEDDVTHAAWFVTPGRLDRGHEAIALVLRSSRHAAVRLLGRAVGARALRPVMTRVYDWVSRNRHRLPGSTDACRIDETDQPG